MARVYVSVVMDATLDQAWGLLRDFGALGNYHPFFEKSYIEDGKAPNRCPVSLSRESPAASL